MARASEDSRLWLPQHWPSWLALAFVWTVAQLPWRWQRPVGRALGLFAYYFVPIRRRVVMINLGLCFPEKSARERRALARAHYVALAQGVFETAMAWWSKLGDYPPYRITGAAHLERAIAGGRGVILLTAHTTTLEGCGRIMTEHFAIGCLYRDPNNPVVARPMRRQRERRMSIAVHFDDLKGLIRALRAGHAIWYAPDQGKRTKQSEILPFFGEPAITNTATGKLAEMTGAPVVPYFARRESDGSYTLTILPPLENFPTSDAAADAIRINRLIEEHVRRAPAQYLWVHKRFKGRGEGYPDVYAR